MEDDIKLDNKRITRNTIFLYIRMLFVMVVNLYTVRAILNILGETDYGIYNVIGGVVSLFSFLGGTLSSASQRFLSIELAKGNVQTLRKVFSLNINVFLFFCLVSIVITETIGLWFVNSKMTIPVDRMYAANVLYQLSIFTFIVTLLQIPYRSLVVAHERMNAFAYIGIVEAILKLLTVGILAIMSYDSLIIYGICTLIVGIIITGAYYTFCILKFKESKFYFFFDKKILKQLLSYSSWHFLGSMSSVLVQYGVNIIINLFFYPAINAARAITININSAITQLGTNVFVAVEPQIYKTYALRNYTSLHMLIKRSAIISSYLITLLIAPLYLNLDFILELWLKNPPEYTSAFAKISLIGCLISGFTGPTIIPALATGRIKRFYIVSSICMTSSLPIIYILYKLGSSPEVGIWITLVCTTLALLSQVYMLKKLINLDVIEYIAIMLKVIFCFAFSIIGSYLLIPNMYPICYFLISSFLLLIIITLIYYIFILSNEERISIKIIITRLLTKLKNK